VRRPPAWELFDWSSKCVLRQSAASKDVNTEAEEATALQAVSRRQPIEMELIEET
jgi:hypothetical protein